MNKRTTIGAVIRKLTRAAICLALCMVLPFLTGQIPQIGSALSPMHIPVLLGGFLCGPGWAAAVGFVAPLLRFVLFGMPPIFPTGLAMSVELMVYGLVSGLLYALAALRWPFLRMLSMPTVEVLQLIPGLAWVPVVPLEPSSLSCPII